MAQPASPSPPAPTTPDGLRWLARLAGAVAALVALVVGELLSATSGTDQSLTASVGTQFINQFAGPLKDLAVSLFGTNDKAALLVGIVVVSTLIGAALGTASLRRRWVGAAGFAAFGLLGLVAGLKDPQTSKPLVVVAAFGATLAGIGTFEWLMRLVRGAGGANEVGSKVGSKVGSTVGSPVGNEVELEVVDEVTDADAVGAAAGGTRARAASTLTAPARRTPARRSRRLDVPTDPAASRRAFFGWAAGAGAFALVGAGIAKAMSGRSNADIARDAVKLPDPLPKAGDALPGAGTTLPPAAGAPMGVDGLTPYVQPTGEFYRIDTALVVPRVDPAPWKLKITGMVDHPYELGFDELLDLSRDVQTVTLQCVSNEIGGDLVGNAVWQGVPLKTVLDRAGIQSGATQIVGASVDGWTAGFPTEVALDGRVAMVAVGMNGEALPIIHGFPARLVVAGLYGYVSATKWLDEIRLTTWEDFDGYWIPRGWSKLGPIKTASRIDVPRQGADLTAGPTKIAGIALAPTRGIRKVEVRVDEGEWRTATLGDTVSDNTWVQWVLDWDATPGRHTIQARATDGTGETQTDASAPPAPDGATGWPSRRVDVT